MKRKWRAPTLEDRARKCRARSRFVTYPFYVEWNSEYCCWGLAEANHILVAVSEILEPAKDKS